MTPSLKCKKVTMNSKKNCTTQSCSQQYAISVKSGRLHQTKKKLVMIDIKCAECWEYQGKTDLGMKTSVKKKLEQHEQ
uniref:Uncharacterized protein n=1 Tax=Arion vulgaris TaxID=1028688 RepID=A0A0B7B1X7_9EUPU